MSTTASVRLRKLDMLLPPRRDGPGPVNETARPYEGAHPAVNHAARGPSLRPRGPVAQWSEQRTHNPSDPGSSPGGPIANTLQISRLCRPGLTAGACAGAVAV